MPQYKRKLSKGYRWRYKFSFNGKIYFSKYIFLNKYEASKAERLKKNDLEEMLRNEYLHKTEEENKTIFLIDLINERLDYLQTTKSVKYYKESQYYLRQLFDILGNVEVSTITKGDINKILMSISKEKQNENRDNYAVNAMLRGIKAMFNYGIQYCNLSITNPCLGIKFFPIDKKLKNIPTDEEINELLSICNQEQRRLVEFVRDTGCRISEALYLRHSDVFDGYVVFYTRKSKSSNLMPRKVKYDTSEIVKMNLNDRVFDSWKQKPKFIYRYINRLGHEKWGWHNLRHRYASKLSNNNIPIFEIMSLLGHTNIGTTQKYLQLLP